MGSFILRLWLFVDFVPGTLTTLLPELLMRKAPELYALRQRKIPMRGVEKQEEAASVNSSWKAAGLCATDSGRANI